MARSLQISNPLSFPLHIQYMKTIKSKIITFITQLSCIKKIAYSVVAWLSLHTWNIMDGNSTHWSWLHLLSATCKVFRLCSFTIFSFTMYLLFLPLSPETRTCNKWFKNIYTQEIFLPAKWTKENSPNFIMYFKMTTIIIITKIIINNRNLYNIIMIMTTSHFLYG